MMLLLKALLVEGKTFIRVVQVVGAAAGLRLSRGDLVDCGDVDAAASTRKQSVPAYSWDVPGSLAAMSGVASVIRCGACGLDG